MKTRKENCCLINFSSAIKSACVLLKITFYTAKKNWLKVCKTIPVNKILLLLTKSTRPPAKDVAPNFFWMRHYNCIHICYFVRRKRSLLIEKHLTNNEMSHCTVWEKESKKSPFIFTGRKNLSIAF